MQSPSMVHILKAGVGMGKGAKSFVAGAGGGEGFSRVQFDDFNAERFCQLGAAVANRGAT